jgi:hypothetical protein
MEKSIQANQTRFRTGGVRNWIGGLDDRYGFRCTFLGKGLEQTT